LQTIPVPKLKDNEVLVNVRSVALNPTDWKHTKFISPPGSLSGIDFAGEVVHVGNNMDPKCTFAVGDRVAGGVHGGLFPDIGAFAEYVRVDAAILWVIPEDTLTMEEATTFGVGFMTAVQAMFHSDRLAMVEYPGQVEEGTWFFVYSGSTSVGQFAIQLARLSGYKVATIASPRHHELLKSLGAEVVFDYKDPQWMQKIKTATNDSIHLALDCYSEGDSQIKSVKTLGPGKGKVWTLWFPAKPVLLRANEVKLEVSLLYTIWGHTWKMMGKTYSSDPSDSTQMADFLREKLPGLLKEKKLKPNPIKVWEGGLEKIEEGFKYMIAGKVSGEKLVYNL